MEFDRNVENILGRIKSLFNDNIYKYIEKTVREQQDKIVQDLLVQAENSFVHSCNGTEISTDTGNGDYIIPVHDDKNKTYDPPYEYRTNPKYNYYDYPALRKWNTEIITNIKSGKGFEPIRRIRDDPTNKNVPFWKEHYKFLSELENFLDNLTEGEYLVFIKWIHKYDYHTNDVREILLLTNFGSTYFTYYPVGDYIIKITKLESEIPKPIIDMFIDYFIDIYEYVPDTYKYRLNFLLESKNPMETFQNWWKSRPLSGHTAELLKKENENLRLQIEETKKEQEKIKYMYETLELKDQYMKAVELLRQNKQERDLLDQTRREFYRERDESKKEIEEMTLKYRQIKDIDTELNRLAAIKQRLEKDRQLLDREKADFDRLREELLHS